MIIHDEAPSIIKDHPFEPAAQWWSLCKHCNLAQAAHSSSTINTQEEIRKDHERQRLWREAEKRREHPGGRMQIGHYVSDDSDD